MHLLHLRLSDPERPVPTSVDAHLIHDALWARCTRRTGIEHIRTRAGPQGIDLLILLRESPTVPIQTRLALLADVLATTPVLGAYRVTAPYPAAPGSAAVGDGESWQIPYGG